MSIEWGSGPPTYPCLVTSCNLGNGRILSCYVSVTEAEDFLRAVGRTLPSATQAPAAAAVPEVPEVPAIAGPHTVSEQDNFRRSITANLLAVAYVLRETKIVSGKRYEELYNEALSMVDEVVTERREAAIAKLDPMDQKIVERLLPP